MAFSSLLCWQSTYAACCQDKVFWCCSQLPLTPHFLHYSPELIKMSSGQHRLFLFSIVFLPYQLQVSAWIRLLDYISPARFPHMSFVKLRKIGHSTQRTWKILKKEWTWWAHQNTHKTWRYSKCEQFQDKGLVPNNWKHTVLKIIL